MEAQAVEQMDTLRQRLAAAGGGYGRQMKSLRRELFGAGIAAAKHFERWREIASQANREGLPMGLTWLGT